MTMNSPLTKNWRDDDEYSTKDQSSSSSDGRYHTIIQANAHHSDDETERPIQRDRRSSSSLNSSSMANSSSSPNSSSSSNLSSSSESSSSITHPSSQCLTSSIKSRSAWAIVFSPHSRPVSHRQHPTQHLSCPNQRTPQRWLTLTNLKTQ